MITSCAIGNLNLIVSSKYVFVPDVFHYLCCPFFQKFILVKLMIVAISFSKQSNCLKFTVFLYHDPLQAVKKVYNHFSQHSDVTWFQ